MTVLRPWERPGTPETRFASLPYVERRLAAIEILSRMDER